MADVVTQEDSGSEVVNPVVVQDTTVYVPRTVQMPKELDDVRALLVSIVSDVKNKKATMSILSDNFPKAVAALQGMEDFAGELKSSHIVDFGALTVGDIVKIFIAGQV